MTGTSVATEEYHPWITYMWASEEARRRGDRRAGTDHLVLGLLQEPTIEALLNVSLQQARQAMESLDGPQDGQVPPIVAAVMAINIYPTSIDKVRLQRVADVMFQFGLLRSRFQIAPMIGP